MTSTGGRLKGWEKAKWGESLGLDKKQDGETHSSFALVGTG